MRYLRGCGPDGRARTAFVSEQREPKIMAAGFFKRRRMRSAVVALALGMLGAGSIFGCGAGHIPQGTMSRAPTGAAIGRYMNRQTSELAKIEYAKIERAGDNIIVTWPSATLFDFDSAMLKLESRERIEKMADVFVRYPDTDIVVACHTSGDSGDEYNVTLSKRRALSIAERLIDLGVAPSRVTAEGGGERRPTATEGIEEQRLSSPIVQIEIQASEDLEAGADAK
jgi:outer membrane protein OmpA-like peptidoglycan-associated protein